MKMNARFLLVVSILTAVLFSPNAPSAVYNLKVLTDASPDYSDLPSMVRSMTDRWETPEEKCWAVFYWNHIARRQTSPMILHGMALTDPIRQFNDYGYAMCSTIAGVNCSIWDAMGLKAKYWDISNHTVSEVEYNGSWHMYDNSMTALYTLCDGKTIAPVDVIGKTGACAASGGKAEPGHIAKYHCLMATSPRGFLTGADTIRSLDEEYRCFNPNGLKYRSYFYDWDRGHRYILNLRDGESYTRHYSSLGGSAEFYVPNEGKDPEAANQRYRIRGNGRRIFRPALSAEHSGAMTAAGLVFSGNGFSPAAAGAVSEAIFKMEGANVITALRVRARTARSLAEDAIRVAVSTVNGLSWNEVWTSARVDGEALDLNLIAPVNGAYEVLVKFTLISAQKPAATRVENLEFETVTMLNSKTQPRLNWGQNVVYVGAGDPTESTVFWPDLRSDNWKPYAAAHTNVATVRQHPGYMGVLYPSIADKEGFVVFKLDAPEDVTRLTYGGRFYNRAPRSRIDLFHSFDGGANWIATYSLTNTAQPWDVIHYAQVDSVPKGVRSVLCKYRLESSVAAKEACSIYAVRMEAGHRPVQPGFAPLEVTFHWSERQADYSMVERSHTQQVTRLPHRYTLNVGGADHPVVQSLRISSLSAPLPNSKLGYSDGRAAAAEKFVPRWVTYGTNWARGAKYTVSVPSTTQWESGDPDGTKLTDGIAGPPYPGGIAPRFALCWNKGTAPEVTVDLGASRPCGAFRIQVGAGWPWWDALKGEFEDQVEVSTSADGVTYASQGVFDFDLRWKDFPVNHFWPDEEEIGGHLFPLILARPVQARFVRFKITPARTVTVSEVEVLDSIRLEPFDLRVALPRD